MIYFAHRGLSEIYPENTLLSFDKAMMAGATAIEFDVHQSKDGELIVIHDENIRKTFNGMGLVKDLTLAELKGFKCKNPRFENNELCKIPTLDEILEIIKNYNLFINIELKTNLIHYSGIEAKVISTLKKYDLCNNTLISSFNPKSLEICKGIDDKIKLGVLFNKNKKRNLDFAINIDAYSINPKVYMVNKKLIDLSHNNGIKVFSYTVNKPSIAINLENLGCDGIFTDNILKFI